MEPFVHSTIWGGTKLWKYVRCDKKIGHLYLVNGHKENANRILNGKLKGKTLHEVFDGDFPLTIALVDAREDLSIQVHPDELLALELEGESLGKTESWIFIDAPKNGWIYGGCSCKTVEEIKKCVMDGKIDVITDHFQVDEMDCVTVNAGTLHSITAGSFVYEVEFGGDHTYRFYDFDRIDSAGNKRELHVEKALKAIKPEGTPEKHSCVCNMWMNEGPYDINILERPEAAQYVNTGAGFEAITILEGNGIADGIDYYPGMGIILYPKESISNVKKAIIARVSERKV